MIPEISEFSYGFALTNELVGWEELRAAPIFPSLIEEGRDGGGYDVNLNFPGVPLFLQFKRSDYMTRRSAGEYKKIVDSGDLISVPFYRFPITEKWKSDQHEMLLTLDDDPANQVFYVAPRFHTLSEINAAWSSSRVASRSIFVRPSDIGRLDYDKHTVAFDGRGAWLCSEPQRVEALAGRDVLNSIKSMLAKTDTPLRQTLPGLVTGMRQAELRGLERIAEARRKAEIEKERLREKARAQVARDEDNPLQQDVGVPYVLTPQPRVRIEIVEDLSQLDAPEPTPVETREPKLLDVDKQNLREAADIAAHVFNAQLVFVQARTANPKSS